ncbi:hypothetical protein TNCV_3626491 [Trichonephila clavipes]|nr:hypothetical protein TNCV_3626491 [Trichonephila clavipes]
MLNDDEIVTSVQTESNPANDETNEEKDNNNSESSKGPSKRFLLPSHGIQIGKNSTKVCGMTQRPFCARVIVRMQIHGKGIRLFIALWNDSSFLVSNIEENLTKRVGVL